MQLAVALHARARAQGEITRELPRESAVDTFLNKYRIILWLMHDLFSRNRDFKSFFCNSRISSIEIYLACSLVLKNIRGQCVSNQFNDTTFQLRKNPALSLFSPEQRITEISCIYKPTHNPQTQVLTPFEISNRFELLLLSALSAIRNILQAR